MKLTLIVNLPAARSTVRPLQGWGWDEWETAAASQFGRLAVDA